MMGDTEFWAGILLTLATTMGGVFLAFALQRSMDRRRQDAVAFSLARRWGRHAARRRMDGTGQTLVRYIAYGRTGPKRPDVQAALLEVDERVERWWSQVTECLVEAEDPFLPDSPLGHRAREWANEIDRELSRALQRFPTRARRLRRLVHTLPTSPILTASGRAPLPSWVGPKSASHRT